MQLFFPPKKSDTSRDLGEKSGSFLDPDFSVIVHFAYFYADGRNLDDPKSRPDVGIFKIEIG